MTAGIINCAGTVFVTCEVEDWRSVTDLLPPEADRQEIGVELGLRIGDDREYYIVMISDISRPGENRLPWEEKVRRVLQHVWDVLTKWGDVTGPMSAIVKGNPLNMLR